MAARGPVEAVKMTRAELMAAHGMVKAVRPPGGSQGADLVELNTRIDQAQHTLGEVRDVATADGISSHRLEKKMSVLKQELSDYHDELDEALKDCGAFDAFLSEMNTKSDEYIYTNRTLSHAVSSMSARECADQIPFDPYLRVGYNPYHSNKDNKREINRKELRRKHQQKAKLEKKLAEEG